MSEGKFLKLTITPQLEGQRIDFAVASLSKECLTRSRIKKLIDEGDIKVDGVNVKPSKRVRAGQLVEIHLPPPQPAFPVAQDIPLNIIYEDSDLIVLNKPAGLVVHPGAGNYQGTLVNALIFHCSSISGGEEFRPGIVHRLDKGTSGVMIVAKNEIAHARLSEMFKLKKIKREYKVLVHGCPPEKGKIETPYGRHPTQRKKFSGKVRSTKKAITRFENIRFFPSKNVSLLKVVLDTGRTHQIRVHMNEAGYPVVGDTFYGRKKIDDFFAQFFGNNPRPLLHSHTIKFEHPLTGALMEFEAEFDPTFAEILLELEKNSKEHI